MRRYALAVIIGLLLVALASWGLYWRELAYMRGTHVFVHCVEL